MGAPAAEYVQVHTTASSREDAERLARGAVEARLAACAQVIGPIASVYWWEGEVDQAEEWLVLLKTSAALFDRLRDHLVEQHSYDVPEVLATPIVAGHAAYLAWLREELESP